MCNCIGDLPKPEDYTGGPLVIADAEIKEWFNVTAETFWPGPIAPENMPENMPDIAAVTRDIARGS